MSESEHRFGGNDGWHERLLREERLRALESFESHLRRQGLVPDSRNLLARRSERLLHVICAGAIGLLVAMFTLLINFILFTKILHIN